jgi:hypothetical protein
MIIGCEEVLSITWKEANKLKSLRSRFYKKEQDEMPCSFSDRFDGSTPIVLYRFQNTSVDY